MEENLNSMPKKGNPFLMQMIMGLVMALLINFISVSPILADEAYKLEISGDGVLAPATFTLDELQSMEKYRHIYSTINTWPTKRFYIAEGVKLRDLLDLAQIKKEAQLIRFISYDGYEVLLTVKELLIDKRYYFPKLTENHATDGSIPGSPADAQEVEPILALMSGENSIDTEQMNDMNTLLLVYGQRAVTEQTNTLFLKHINRIEVLSTPPEKWDKPKANINSEEIMAGTQIRLNSKGNDIDKVYYTTDGSTPTVDSPIFNWSAKRWWNQRPDNLQIVNQPLEINRDTVIKAKVIGPGKEDSEVITFTYRIGQGNYQGSGERLPTAITLDRDHINLRVGGSFIFDATIVPDEVIDRHIVWSSSDTRVATVDQNGLVTMIKDGMAVITAQVPDEGVEASCIVASTNFTAGGEKIMPDQKADETKLSVQEAGEAKALGPELAELGNLPRRGLAEEHRADEEGIARPEEKVKERPGNLVYLAEKKATDPDEPSAVFSPVAYNSDLFEVLPADGDIFLPEEQGSLGTLTSPIIIMLFFSGAFRRYLNYTKEAKS